MQDFQNAAYQHCPFGTSPEGRLLYKLDTLLQDRRHPYFKEELQSFFNKNEIQLALYSDTKPLFAIAMLRISTLIDNRELFEHCLSICLNNDFPWENDPDGDQKKQNKAKTLWVTFSTEKKWSSLDQKLELHSKCLLEGNDPYAIKDVLRLGLSLDHLRKKALLITEKAVRKYPKDTFIAAAHISLSAPELRRDLIKQYMVQFHDNDTFTKVIKRKYSPK